VRVSSVGRAFSPECLRETGVNEVGADEVEDCQVNAFNPSVLSMSIRRNSNVLDSESGHVVVPILGGEFSPVVAAEGLDLRAELSFHQGNVGLGSRSRNSEHRQLKQQWPVPRGRCG
jgi:hypothetical protein